jgi:hypothetical protein
MQRHGWTLLFHDCVIEQLQKLHAAARRAQENDPEGLRVQRQRQALPGLESS